MLDLLDKLEARINTIGENIRARENRALSSLDVVNRKLIQKEKDFDIFRSAFEKLLADRDELVNKYEYIAPTKT